MASAGLSMVLRHMRTILAADSTGGTPDRELLERFITHQDESAFAAILQRHGGMVLGICRRVLRRGHDAEDAFQATFLVLVRRARSIRKPESLRSWLHGVAYRVASDLRTTLDRQPAQSWQEDASAQADPATALTWQEVQTALDAELCRLPDKYRIPLILCYLDGKTRDEAAHELDCSVGALRGRLERGRTILRHRLTRRGVSLSATLLAAALAEGTTLAALPTSVISSTLQAAQAFTRNPALLAGIASARVAGLVKGVLRTMFWLKLRSVAAIGLAVMLLGIGVGTLGYHLVSASPPAVVAAEPAPAAQPMDPQAEQVHRAIARGINYLKAMQRKGNWEAADNTGRPGGATALALLALLEAGVVPEDESIEQGLEYLRPIESKHTYVLGLQTAVLSRARLSKDKDHIQRNVDFLLESRTRDSKGRFHGWSYGHIRSGGSDNSNTQFAILALEAASKAGVKVEEAIWKEIQEYYLRIQHTDGGWCYNPWAGSKPTLSMTAAGVSGLLISSKHVKKKAPGFDAGLARGLRYLGDHLRVGEGVYRYYLLHSCRRAGRLTGKEVFPGSPEGRTQEWYRPGVRFLLDAQGPDGAWKSASGVEADPIIATSFALLFLSWAAPRFLVHPKWEYP